MMTIPIDFAMANASLSWSELLWGLDRQLISRFDAIAFAGRQTLDPDDPLLLVKTELDMLGKDDSWRVSDLLHEIVASETERRGRQPGQVWLYLSLLYIWKNKDTLPDPLGEVERIYADFDYPERIKEFVRFMPPSDGYDPRQHSEAQNIERLNQKWSDYLSVEGFLTQPS